MRPTPAFQCLLSPAPDAVFVRLARIRGLFCARRPFHVAGFIVSVVIDALQRQFRRRSGADIVEEIHKAVSPRLSNLDSACSIVVIRGGVWIVAALNHRQPHAIFLAATHRVGAFLCLASARFRHPDAEISDKDRSFCPAHTPTVQESQSVSARGFTEHRPRPDDGARVHRASQRIDVLRGHRGNSISQLTGDFAWT